LLLPALAVTLVAVAPASAQFFPYYGKNKVTYDNFTWRVYKTPHFEIYYYPEFEQHLGRVTSYLESAYQKVSSTLKHEIGQPIPVILYKTHSEFEQTNLGGGFIPEAVQAFAEPVRGRMVLPIDEPPDKLQGLITHELTHVFEFDIIPRSLVQRTVPLWLDEGLSDYMRATWDPLDLMSLRDAAITDQIPKLSRFNVDYSGVSNPRLIYNMGHAAFEFIEARYGKEGIRQFLYTFRKNIVAGGLEDIYQQAFRTKPEEFDEAFDKWLKERFKPFRDKQRPSDYGQDLAPNSEKTAYTQVFGFAPSPSGEVIAAFSGNRSEGELDLLLLSAHDGAVIRNLTKGFTNKFEEVTYNDDFVAGRTVSFDPHGDTIAFFARKGKRRSLYLASALNGDIVKRYPIREDQAQAPCLLPDGRHALYAATKDGIADIFELDLETGESKNLTDDAYHDNDPQASPDGKLVVYSRRISGHTKIMLMALDDPSHRTQLTFGAHSDNAPTFSSDGNLVYFSSTEDDDIPNLRSLDLRTGAVRQYTDALGGNMAPAVLPGKGGERLAFISYFKGEYRLQAIDTTEPIKEVEQEAKMASEEETIDFQPDVTHEVVPENKRKKRTFEKLFLEGRPPLNVGVTSGGDFFGGSQIALADVLGDHNFTATALSVQEFRSYEGTYLNLSRRLHFGLSAYDYTSFFYSAPYGLQNSFSRAGAIATRRYTGASAIGQYPLSKFHRVEFSAAIVNRPSSSRTPMRSSSRASRRRLWACRSRSTRAASRRWSSAWSARPPASATSGRWPGTPTRSGSSWRRASTASCPARRYRATSGSTSTSARAPCSRRACACSTRAATTPTSSSSAATWSCGASRTCRSRETRASSRTRSCACPSST
jgi:Tol biopolymer transport system component